MRKRLPDLLLEQLRLGELPERTRLEVLADPDTAERLRFLEESDAEILKRYPPKRIATQIRVRAKEEGDPGVEIAKSAQAAIAPKAGPGPEGSDAFENERRGAALVSDAEATTSGTSSIASSDAAFRLRRFAARGRLLPLLAALLVVGIGLVPVILSTVGAPASRRDASEIRVKGLLPALRIYREGARGVELLHDGSRVRRGDLLQIGYVAGGARYGMIFSVDGTGAMTLHLPERANGATELQPDGQVLLPFSYELDSAPRFERFIFVTASSPFSVSQVLQAERQAVAKRGPNALPSLSSAFSVVTVTLDKGEP